MKLEMCDLQHGFGNIKIFILRLINVHDVKIYIKFFFLQETMNINAFAKYRKIIYFLNVLKQFRFPVHEARSTFTFI